MCQLQGNDPNYTPMKPIRHSPLPAQLWILDIDGTLMPSHAVDNHCYWQAVNDYFGNVPVALDLHQFQHVTDGSILNEWMETTRGRTATEAEISWIRRRFLELLEQAFEIEPAAFTAFPGLFDWLDLQLEAHDHCIAIATGGWSHTARFKLMAAGLEPYAFPLASSDDASTRTDIMLKARDLLLQQPPHTPAERESPDICYIGDGIWDYLASQTLGWRFIGIAEDQRARALRDAGANQVYRHFAEWTASGICNAAAGMPVDHAGY